MAPRRLTVSTAQIAAAKLKLKRAAAAGRQVDQAVRAIAAARRPSEPSGPDPAAGH